MRKSGSFWKFTSHSGECVVIYAHNLVAACELARDYFGAAALSCRRITRREEM